MTDGNLLGKTITTQAFEPNRNTAITTEIDRTVASGVTEIPNLNDFGDAGPIFVDFTESQIRAGVLESANAAKDAEPDDQFEGLVFTDRQDNIAPFQNVSVAPSSDVPGSELSLTNTDDEIEVNTKNARIEPGEKIVLNVTNENNEPDFSTIQANVFLQNGGTFTASEPVEAFGSNGNEAVLLRDGATGSKIDGNVERIDLPTAVDNTSFQVSDGSFQITEGSDTLFTFTAGLNRDVELRFEGGDLDLRQTGGTTFEVEGANGQTQTIGSSPVTPSVALGPNVSSTATADTSGGEEPVSRESVTIGGLDDGRTFTAGDGAKEFSFVKDDLSNIKIVQFGSDDALNFLGLQLRTFAIGGENPVAADGEIPGSVFIEAGLPNEGGQLIDIELTNFDDSLDFTGSIGSVEEFQNAFGQDSLVVPAEFA